MTPDTFHTALAIAEEIRQQIYGAFRSKRRAMLQETLGRLKQLGGNEMMPYVQVQIGGLMRKPQKCVLFAKIDVACCDDGELFIVGHDPTPRTFLLGEELVTVPEDQCPRCLGERRLDFRNKSRCPACGAELGKDLRIVAKDDVCPFCEEPHKEGAAGPCSCGFDWDSEYVVKM